MSPVDCQHGTSLFTSHLRWSWIPCLEIGQSGCLQCALGLGQSGFGLPRVAQVGFRLRMQCPELADRGPIVIGCHAPRRSPLRAGSPLCQNHIDRAVGCKSTRQIHPHRGITLVFSASHTIEGTLTFPQSSRGIAHFRQRSRQQPPIYPYKVLAGDTRMRIDCGVADRIERRRTAIAAVCSPSASRARPSYR
jgi:hypothetical protein